MLKKVLPYVLSAIVFFLSLALMRPAPRVALQRAAAGEYVPLGRDV